jgi:nucleoside-diphosphate-sugar epimerase
VAGGKRVFLVGGHTYLGSRAAAVFLERDYEVTCLAHEKQDTVALRTIGAEIVNGSVLEPEEWKNALKRCDAALNLHDHFDLRGTPKVRRGIGKVFGRMNDRLHRTRVREEQRLQRLLRAVNYDGAVNFIETAIAMDVPKVLTLSSVFAIGDQRGAMADENTRHRRAFRSYYEKTMYDALFKTRVKLDEGAQLACVIPGVVVGPRKEGPFARVIEGFVTGELPYVVEGNSQMTFTYIDDLVRGIFQILDQRAPSGQYIFGNDPVTWTEFWSKLGRISGVTPRDGAISEGAAKATLGGARTWSRFRGRSPVLQPEVLEYMVDCQFRFSSAKAKREVGWDDTPMEIWMAELVEEIKSAAQGPATQAAVETFARGSGLPAGY